MKNSIKFLFSALIILMAGFFLGQSFQVDKTAISMADSQEAVPEELAPVSLMLDDGGADLKIYPQISIEKESTVFSVLQNLSNREDDLKLDFDPPGEWGVFIKQIGEKKNGEENKYWQYFVNNKQPMVAADRYKLKGGEAIMFKFMESKF